MRRTIWIVLAVAWAASSAHGDIVYLRDGKRYEGKVTRRGETVLIEVQQGTITTTISVPADQIERIGEAPLPTQPAKAPAGEAPTSQPRGGETIARAVNPEPNLFAYMRLLSVTPTGPATAGLQDQVATWRAFCHDRKRKAGAEWYRPEDFIRRRETFAIMLKEARDLARQTDRIKGQTLDERAERNRLAGQAGVKMRQAAGLWLDDLLRTFLTAAAEWQTGQYAQAEALFLQCRRQAPLIAAFHQGYAMVLPELNRPLEGLDAAMEALRLCPDSADALQLVRDVMRKVPGAQLQTPAYRKAKEVVDQYEPVRASGYTSPTTTAKPTNWLMPGKPWSVRDNTMPDPAYDRLVFLQAVAVPVGKHSLLVDDAVVRGAQQLLVRIDENTVVPAKAGRSDATGRPGGPPSPLAMITVSDREFTPLAADVGAGGPRGAKPVKEASPALAPGQEAVAYALGLYPELGSEVRQMPVKVESLTPEGAPKLSGRLAAGEAASPLIDQTGKLLGFLAGKTDWSVYDGGPDRFIPVADLAGLIKRAGTGGVGSGTSGYGYGYGGAPARRTTAPQQAPGRTFVVIGIVGEKFTAGR